MANRSLGAVLDDPAAAVRPPADAGPPRQLVPDPPSTSRPSSASRSFSAGSTATIATKYSFFQVFRDLQNYLAEFLKTLQDFAKNRKFHKNSAKFPDFCKKTLIFAKIADFCEILQMSSQMF